MPGPAPTPTPILRLRGSWRGDSRPDEPQPEALRDIAPPGWLPEGPARDVWADLAPRLLRTHVLTEADVRALGRYCVLWVRWKQAEDYIEEHGNCYPLLDDKGDVRYYQQYPEVAIAHKLVAALLKLEQEFGLTPSSRTRIHAHAPDEKPPQAQLKEFLSAR